MLKIVPLSSESNKLSLNESSEFEIYDIENLFFPTLFFTKIFSALGK